MEIPTLKQLQPQTIDALNNFLILWNQDPLAVNNSLIITEISIIVHDGIDIITSYIPKTEPDLPT